MDAVRMPFGKFRGQLLEDIPLSYLAWLFEQATGLSERLEQAILAELRLRLAINAPAPALAPGWEEVARRWHAQLALKHHPDRGGSTAAMRVVNEAYELLREMAD